MDEGEGDTTGVSSKKWMGTEGFMLSKVSQTGKDPYHTISFIYKI